MAVEISENATVKLFNDRFLDFSTILTASGNQVITGFYSFNNLTADAIDVKSINGQQLSDLVYIGETGETQIIDGQLEIDQMSITKSLKVFLLYYFTIN